MGSVPFGNETRLEPWGLDVLRARQYKAAGKGVRIGVLDSGWYRDHPGLENKVVAERNFVDPGSPADDFTGHGTAVAGIMCGGGHGESRFSVAPDAELVVAKVLTSNAIRRLEDVEAAIEWAIDQGCRILNCSFGRAATAGPPEWNYREIARKALHDRGVLIVAAAGNTTMLEEPACAEAVMAVGALDRQLRLMRGSPRHGIDLAAPGHLCKTCKVPSEGAPELYFGFSHTSAAAPHIAGLAALLLQEDPSMNGVALWAKVWQTAHRLGLVEVA